MPPPNEPDLNCWLLEAKAIVLDTTYLPTYYIVFQDGDLEIGTLYKNNIFVEDFHGNNLFLDSKFLFN